MYRRIHRLGGYLAALGICLLVTCGLQALLLDQGRQEEPWATDRGGGVKEEKGEEKKSTGEELGRETGHRGGKGAPDGTAQYDRRGSTSVSSEEQYGERDEYVRNCSDDPDDPE